MDDDTQRAHKQDLANLEHAFREARERSGLRSVEAQNDAVGSLRADGAARRTPFSRPRSASLRD
jgi:hypothetical protein